MDALLWFSIGVFTTIAVYFAGRIYEGWRMYRDLKGVLKYELLRLFGMRD